jgi:Transposase domain (DUF772)
MMGREDDRQQTLFYDFCFEDYVPEDHLLRQIAKVLDLSEVRLKLAPYYSAMGRPSLDPELMIRMLLIGYLYGIRSERRLVEEVHLNLAYRWIATGGPTCPDRTPIIMTPTGPVPIHMVTIPITRDRVAGGASVRIKVVCMFEKAAVPSPPISNSTKAPLR